MLRLGLDFDWSEQIVDPLEALACVAAESARPERAARLLGAAERFRQERQLHRSDLFLQTATERARSAARDALGGDAFAAEWTCGSAMEIDEAISYALSSARP